MRVGRAQARPAGQVDRDPLGATWPRAPRPRPDRLRRGWAPSATARSPRSTRRSSRTWAPTIMLLTPFIPALGAFVMSGVLHDSRRSRRTSPACSRTSSPTDAIRGAGRPEATHLIEVMHRPARGRARAWTRSSCGGKNFIPPDDFPHETAIGIVYDSGNYQGTLDKLLEHLDLDALPRGAGASCATQGVHRGIGFSTYMEICGLAPSRAVGPQRRRPAGRPAGSPRSCACTRRAR